jgi:uncharacterized membrane protein
MADRRRLAVVATAILTMVVGLWLRQPLRDYQGPADAGAFSAYSFEHVGAYSDIATLYVRDFLWEHPVPYIDRDLEYPVLTGSYIWLASFVNGTVWSYLLVSWFGLMICGAFIAYMLAGRAESDPWVFALAPSLALYVVLNWDLLSLAATVAALVLFERRKDVAAGGALVVAVWTKLFPVLLVPLMVAQRWFEGDRRGALRLGGIVGAGSIIVNLPVFLAAPDGWAHVFRFNRDRPRELNIWNAFDPIETATVNRWSAVLLVAGLLVAVVCVAAWSKRARPVAPVFLALLAWAFFLSKVYSPQYSLWIVVLLAYVGVSRALSISFIAVDVVYFIASFVVLYLIGNQELSGWFFDEVLWPAALVREAFLAGLAAWGLWIAGRARPPEALEPA